VTPRKRLGQHFLVDQNILKVIDRLAAVGPDEVVLEVGPGLGVLTEHLARRARLVHAVEIDRGLEPELERRLGGYANVRLLFEDALALEPASLKPPPTRLVANLPYNVATPIVVESLDGYPSVEAWCVMVQREVADRFFARPATKAYGAVSVLVQLVTRRTGSHQVSRTVFRPQPNVDSALVAFQRVGLPAEYPSLKRLVVAAFAHRRKTLANGLELAGVSSRREAVAALTSLGLAEGVRAEALTPNEFVRLERALG
jgi:16S rRNA (adenine1518-N6/adenine1519-N6)-dimethyltransferase